MPVNFLLDIFVDSMGWVLQAFARTIALIGNLSFSISTTALTDGIVVEIIRYVQTIATVVLCIKMVYEIIQTYSLGRANDPDQSPGWIVLHTGIATALIWSVPAITGFIADWGAKVMADLASLNLTDLAQLSSRVDSILPVIQNIPLVDALLYIGLFQFLCIVLIIAMFQLLIRGLEIVVLGVIAPFIFINASSQNRSLVMLWLKQCIALIGTQFIQMFILFMAVGKLLNIETIGFEDILIAGLWTCLSLAAPKTVQIFMTDSGGAGSGVKALASAGGAAMRGIV